MKKIITFLKLTKSKFLILLVLCFLAYLGLRAISPFGQIKGLLIVLHPLLQLPFYLYYGLAIVPIVHWSQIVILFVYYYLMACLLGSLFTLFMSRGNKK